MKPPTRRTRREMMKAIHHHTLIVIALLDRAPQHRGLSAQSPTSRRTGSSAFADDDTEFERSSEAPMNAPFKLADEPATTFVRRHIGPSPREVAAMLETVGVKSLSELMDETLPASIRQKAPLDLGRALSETEALAHMGDLASQNQVFTSLIGQGYSGTILPAVIQRNILENPAWYTAYTPYQPEISQGRLEALFNFQTMIADLTGLDVANASLLDEATAAAEAMALAERAAQAKSKSFFVDAEVHPQTLAVLRTRGEALGWHLVVGDPLTDLGGSGVFGALLQYPGSYGAVRVLTPVHSP